MSALSIGNKGAGGLHSVASVVFTDEIGFGGVSDVDGESGFVCGKDGGVCEAGTTGNKGGRGGGAIGIGSGSATTGGDGFDGCLTGGGGGGGVQDGVTGIDCDGVGCANKADTACGVRTSGRGGNGGGRAVTTATGVTGTVGADGFGTTIVALHSGQASSSPAPS